MGRIEQYHRPCHNRGPPLPGHQVGGTSGTPSPCPWADTFMVGMNLPQLVTIVWLSSILKTAKAESHPYLSSWGDCRKTTTLLSVCTFKCHEYYVCYL